MIEFDKNKPIYIQLMNILKFDIASGKFSPGEKLKSVREMASDFNVNPNTMQRALGELEREELLYSQRTSGRFVTENKEMIVKMRNSLAKSEIISLKENLLKLGYDENEILDVITKSIKELE